MVGTWCSWRATTPLARRLKLRRCSSLPRQRGGCFNNTESGRGPLFLMQTDCAWLPPFQRKATLRRRASTGFPSSLLCAPSFKLRVPVHSPLGTGMRRNLARVFEDSGEDAAARAWKLTCRGTVYTVHRWGRIFRLRSVRTLRAPRREPGSAASARLTRRRLDSLVMGRSGVDESSEGIALLKVTEGSRSSPRPGPREPREDAFAFAL